MAKSLFLYSSLMRTGNFHVFTVLGDCTASDLNSLRLQNARDLFVGQRFCRIFIFNQLLHTAFKDQKRSIASFRSVYALAEEVTKLENALWSVRVFAGDCATNRGGMHSDLLCYFLDHHRLQFINPPFQEVTLAGHDGVADFQNCLLTLLDIFDELDCALETFLNVIPRVAVISVFGEQALICGIEP